MPSSCICLQELTFHLSVWAGSTLCVRPALWHFLADFIGNGAHLDTGWALHFLLICLPVVAYRLLMTWVYDHTESVPLAQLMHAMYTGTLVVVSPALWQLPFTLLLWLLVTTIYLAGRRKLAHNW